MKITEKIRQKKKNRVERQKWEEKDKGEVVRSFLRGGKGAKRKSKCTDLNGEQKGL